MENKMTELEALSLLRNQCNDLFLKTLRYQSAYGESLQMSYSLECLLRDFDSLISNKIDYAGRPE